MPTPTPPLEIVNDAMEIDRRFLAYAFGAAPADNGLATKLQTIPGVQADRLSVGAEMLYAHRDLLDDAGLVLMAQMFEYGRLQHWSIFLTDDRALGIVFAVRRDRGEAGEFDAMENDPKPVTSHRAEGFDWLEAALNPPAEPEE